MFQQKFINRERELKFLEDAYRRREAQLIIIYGRRRVGKTELVNQFLKDKPHIYFISDSRGNLPNLIELKKIMATFLKDALLDKADIRGWTELFAEFIKRVDQKMVIAIDEFPYLIEADNSLVSVFQKIWDSNLSGKDIMLILLGSSIGIMETQVLGYRAPLYGRRTGQWRLEVLELKHLPGFLSYGIEDLIKAYSIVDGIPLYLMQFDRNLTLVENMKTRVFTRGQFLYEEAEILLRQELREPANYFNILKAIASGKHKFGDVVNFSVRDKSLVSKYLDNLINLRVIRKEFPITQKKETRNALYKFADNYLNFWFRFVYPNKSLIESDRHDVLLDQLKAELNLHYSSVFEGVCTQFLRDAPDKHFEFNKIGRWWHKDKEIDIVALNERTNQILFCECKWQRAVNAEKVLDELKEKAWDVEWNNRKREEHYAVFGKTFKKKIMTENVSSYDLDDIAGLVSPASKNNVVRK